MLLDTSFAVHALVQTQRTEPAASAFGTALTERAVIVVPAHVVIEFGSFLRKAITRRALAPQEADRAMQLLLRGTRLVPTTEFALESGFQLAARLNAPDTFDTTGYALAHDLGAEFWVCDKRFHNAAEAAGLGGVRFFP